MPPRKQPAKADEPKEEITRVEVTPEYSIKVRPDLYHKMMKIGSQEYWQHVLENYYHELAKRYRR